MLSIDDVLALNMVTPELLTKMESFAAMISPANARIVSSMIFGTMFFSISASRLLDHKMKGLDEMAISNST